MNYQTLIPDLKLIFKFNIPFVTSSAVLDDRDRTHVYKRLISNRSLFHPIKKRKCEQTVTERPEKQNVSSENCDVFSYHQMSGGTRPSQNLNTAK